MRAQAQLSGLHSRSEELIDLTRFYDRGQASWAEVEARLKVETSQIIQLQDGLGFEYVTDGAISWQDPLRPLTRALTGITTGTRYSRWFDTNTFYQKPIITGKVSSDRFEPTQFLQAQLLPKNRKWKVSLPGPYTFSELSENKHYENTEGLVLDIARAEREIIQRLALAGCSLVQLSEPCLLYRPYRDDPLSHSEAELALRALRLLGENGSTQLLVHTFFGDAAPLLPQLLELPVAGVGFDLYETDFSSLRLKTTKTLELGIVDARESHVEDPKWIVGTADRLVKHVKGPDLVFSPNSDLRYLPREVADEKTRALAEAALAFKEDA
jgi:5-methyltetrahydropteroyltriglutamate--homocysteine methyltransferase